MLLLHRAFNFSCISWIMLLLLIFDGCVGEGVVTFFLAGLFAPRAGCWSASTSTGLVLAVDVGLHLTSHCVGLVELTSNCVGCAGILAANCGDCAGVLAGSNCVGCAVVPLLRILCAGLSRCGGCVGDWGFSVNSFFIAFEALGE